MKKMWLILIGVVAFVLVLVLGAAAGGAAAYFLFRDDITPVFASPAGTDSAEGVIVSYVAESSPAAEAGLVRGDILMKIGTQETDSFIELTSALKSYDPGDTVELSVLHGDDLRTLSVELGEQDGSAYLGISTCGGPVWGEVMIDGGPLAFDREVEFIGAGGVVITEVVEDSPASDAGLEVGDIILTVDGDEIKMDTNLAVLIGAYKPGDLVKLGVIRAEEEMEIDVKLGENPDQDGQAYLGVYYSPAKPMIRFDREEKGSFFFNEESGIPFGNFDDGEWLPFLHREFPDLPNFEDLPEGVENAIVISEVVEGTAAEEAGLQKHDLILYVDGDPVSGLDAFIADIQSRSPGEQINLTVLRGSEEIKISVTLGEHPDHPEYGYLGVVVGGFIKIRTEGKNQDGLKFELDEDFKLPGGDA